MSKEMKHSAYKSMVLAKEGKTKRMDGNLEKWIDEKWRNLTPLILGDNKFYECGKKSEEQIKKNLPSICRPTVKIDKETPNLANNYNKKQLKEAVQIKKKGKIIKWDKLKK
jgi:hypothetical protein